MVEEVDRLSDLHIAGDQCQARVAAVINVHPPALASYATGWISQPGLVDTGARQSTAAMAVSGPTWQANFGGNRKG